MYGLVNRAIQDLIVEEYGESTWREVRRLAGVQEDSFVSMDPYPDALTYSLVQAAATYLDAPPEELLEAFGRYWVLYTAREGYGDLLDQCGQSFEEFLDQLDALHSRVALTFPELLPPSFELAPSDTEDNTMLLYYRSSREGLAPMVVGLLKGLAERFSTHCRVELVGPTERGCCFRIYEDVTA